MREGGYKRGGMNCYRSRGKAKQRYVARGIYMEIPYAFGKTCFSSRLVSSCLVSFREMRLHGYVYINTGPSNQLRETSLASFLRKLHPLPYLCDVLHFPLSSSPPSSLSIFVPSRSINSRSLTHSGSRYTARDHSATPFDKHGFRI